MSSPATSAVPVQRRPSGPSGSAAPEGRDLHQVGIFLTTLVAGGVGCLIAYWTWRMVLRLPLAVAPDFGLAGGQEPPDVAAWAPWWVPTAIVGAVAMVLWPILATHARRISLVGGAATIVLVSILFFPVAALCLQFASLTSHGWPPVLELVGALPRVLAEAVRLTFVNLMYSGAVTVPLAALIGLLLAAFGRLITWMVDWLARMRAG
jgi:hypothetical protein